MQLFSFSFFQAHVLALMSFHLAVLKERSNFSWLRICSHAAVHKQLSDAAVIRQQSSLSCYHPTIIKQML
jgi:hypothetical protein